MNFQWSDDYKCNVEEIDTQHKKLFELGRKVSELIEKQDYNEDEVLEIYKELKDYVIYHFKTEEGLMLRISYPEYKEHKEKHVEFIKELSKFSIEKINLKGKETLKELLLFIGTWIIKHIFSVDMRYMSYFSKSGIK